MFSGNPSFRNGGYFGASGLFAGVAVTFDTFRNTERASIHRDISIVVTNGSKDITDLDMQAPGCDSAYRWHEGRDDFNINNHAEARFSYNVQTKLFKVSIDAKGDGNFRSCAEATLPFNDDWQKYIFYNFILEDYLLEYQLLLVN